MLILVVLELIRGRRLKERYALLWLVTGVVLLVLSVWRDGLNTIAGWLGVSGYPPAILFAAAILFVIVVLLHYSTVLSKLDRREQRLRAAPRAARAVATRCASSVLWSVSFESTGGVVQEHRDHEQDRGGEQDRRREAADPEPARDRVEAVSPDGEDEQHEPGHEPQQRVALLEPPPRISSNTTRMSSTERDRGGDRDRTGVTGYLPPPGSGVPAMATSSASVTLSM